MADVMSEQPAFEQRPAPKGKKATKEELMRTLRSKESELETAKEQRAQAEQTVRSVTKEVTSIRQQIIEQFM